MIKVALVTGLLFLVALPWVLANDSAALALRHDFGVARGMRDMAAASCLCGASLSWTCAIGLWERRKSKSRSWPDPTGTFLFVMLMSGVPCIAAAILHKELYADLQQGGVVDPIPKGLFRVLRDVWLLATVAFLLHTMWWSTIGPGRGWRKRVRDEDAGIPLCRRCAYNLTGNVSGKCPECGTAVESQAARAKHPPA
jgi:hypothetical protein